jgi:hypothetical protein
MSKFALFSAVLALHFTHLARAEDAPQPQGAPAASSPASSEKTPLDSTVRIGSDDEISNVATDSWFQPMPRSTFRTALIRTIP